MKLGQTDLIQNVNVRILGRTDLANDVTVRIFGGTDMQLGRTDMVRVRA